MLLYDGVCGFCNRSVQFILKHDKRGTLKFTALQNATGRQMLSRYPELHGVDSLVFVEDGDDARGERVFVRSTGALKVAAYLGGFWRVFLIGYLLPRPIRDFFYDRFARYRYRLFGKAESCMVPPPQARSRFLE